MAKSALRYWFILIYAKPGQGKSLEQARLSEQLLKEYAKTEKKYPGLPHRIMVTNQTLSDDIRKREMMFTYPVLEVDDIKQGLKKKKPLVSMRRKKKDEIPLPPPPPSPPPKKVLYVDREHPIPLPGNRHLIEWDEPDHFRYCPRVNCWKGNQTHKLHDADIMIDEGATLFPADMYKYTPLWLRKMWAQHRHNGIRIVMLTQDYKAIDVNCRRMVWQAYFVHKIMGSRDISPTLPPLVKWSPLNVLNPRKSVVWGLYSVQRVDPQILEGDPLTMLGLKLDEEKAEAYAKLKLVGVSTWHLITWHKVNLYDTTQDVREFSLKREYEHIEGKCENPMCEYIHVGHRLK